MKTAPKCVVQGNGTRNTAVLGPLVPKSLPKESGGGSTSVKRASRRGKSREKDWYDTTSEEDVEPEEAEKL